MPDSGHTAAIFYRPVCKFSRKSTIRNQSRDIVRFSQGIHSKVRSFDASQRRERGSKRDSFQDALTSLGKGKRFLEGGVPGQRSWATLGFAVVSNYGMATSLDFDGMAR